MTSKDRLHLDIVNKLTDQVTDLQAENARLRAKIAGPEQRCERCRFWRVGTRDAHSGEIVLFDEPWGDCLLHPPSMVHSVEGVIFPRTHKDDFCREIQYA